MLKAIILAIFVISGTTVFASDAPAATAETESKTLVVKKMTCGGCASKVKKSLSAVEGMKFIKADPKTNTVEIEITDAKSFDIDKAIAAIKKGTGWDATEKAVIAEK